MPFSKENRMVTFMIIMITLVGVFTMWAAMTIQLTSEDHDQYRTYVVAGIGLLIIKAFLGLLASMLAARKAEQAAKTVMDTGKRIEAKVNEIEEKTNGGRTEAMQIVRQAEKDQIINDPRFLEELGREIRKIVEDCMKNK